MAILLGKKYISYYRLSLSDNQGTRVSIYAWTWREAQTKKSRRDLTADRECAIKFSMGNFRISTFKESKPNLHGCRNLSREREREEVGGQVNSTLEFVLPNFCARSLEKPYLFTIAT